MSDVARSEARGGGGLEVALAAGGGVSVHPGVQGTGLSPFGTTVMFLFVAAVLILNLSQVLIATQGNTAGVLTATTTVVVVATVLVIGYRWLREPVFIVLASCTLLCLVAAGSVALSAAPK